MRNIGSCYPESDTQYMLLARCFEQPSRYLPEANGPWCAEDGRTMHDSVGKTFHTSILPVNGSMNKNGAREQSILIMQMKN